MGKTEDELIQELEEKKKLLKRKTLEFEVKKMEIELEKKKAKRRKELLEMDIDDVPEDEWEEWKLAMHEDNQRLIKDIEDDIADLEENVIPYEEEDRERAREYQSQQDMADMGRFGCQAFGYMLLIVLAVFILFVIFFV